LKQQKSLLITASVALTNLEEMAHHTTNLSRCPIWLIHATPLMINQFDKRLESLRGGSGISTPVSLFQLHYSLLFQIYSMIDSRLFLLNF
jgi:hypothetical protein